MIVGRVSFDGLTPAVLFAYVAFFAVVVALHDAAGFFIDRTKTCTLANCRVLASAGNAFALADATIGGGEAVP